MARVAVVTPAAGRHRHLAAQHVSLASGRRSPDVVVVVAMGDDDLSEPWPAAVPARRP